ncbi:MAG: hypothetical protein ACK4TA_10915 [Saprospiraceae bacterium]
MQRISTNLTLFYKFFIPTFYLAFFGAFTILSFSLRSIPLFGRFIIVGLFLASAVFFYFTLLRLKRVEIDEQFIYVTNYFKHYRYSLDSIEKIVERDFLVFRTATIHLHQAGSFGKKMFFVPSGSLYNDFWKNHPNLRVDLLRKK